MAIPKEPWKKRDSPKRQARPVRSPEEAKTRSAFRLFLKNPTRENEEKAKRAYQAFYKNNRGKALQLKSKTENVLRKACMERIDGFVSDRSKSNAKKLENSIVILSSLNETDARVLTKHLEKICFEKEINFRDFFSIQW